MLSKSTQDSSKSYYFQIIVSVSKNKFRHAIHTKFTFLTFKPFISKRLSLVKQIKQFLTDNKYFYMENSRYIINKEFLDGSKYQDLLQHTYIYENLFKTWLGQITDNYRGSEKPQPFSLHNNSPPLQFTKESFENLVYPFITKLYDISTGHLVYISSIMRQSNSLSIERDFDRIMAKIKSFNQCHQNFLNTYKQLLSAQNRIVLEPTHNAQFYYYSNWFKRLNALQNYLKSLKYLQECKPDKEKLYKISEQIQQELLQLRKRIMDCKYGYLKQGVKLSRQLLKCLSEYLTMGIQILTKMNGKIKMQIASQTPNPKGFRHSGSLIDMDQEFRQNYENKAESFRKTLKNIQKLFLFSNPVVDKKSLFENFTRIYSGNEDLLNEMFDVYSLFEALCNNRKIMNEKLNLILSKIDSEHKSKRKVAEVLNTLNKRRSLDEERTLTCSIDGSRSLEIISNQFDIKNILKSVSDSIQYSLKCFTDLSQMCYKCSIKGTQRRQTDTNMDISYQYKQIKIKARKPCLEEIWLWRDWRQFKTFTEIQPKYDEKTISKQLAQIKSFMQDGDDTGEKITCYIEGKSQGKASLEIFPEKIQILSKKQSTANFILPFKYIEYVEPRKKNLVIKMQGGSELTLSSFKDMVETEKRINQQLLSREGNQNGLKGELLPAKPSITITPEQLSSIEKRASEMERVKPNLKEYTKYVESTIKGITIQEVYQSICSDKDSCPLSKNNSFFNYVNEKSGNFNITSTKYDKEGPYFYAGINKDITFLNCPLFSVRMTQLDHPLPPIPFLPKKIHCKSEETIFWISNKELQYKADVSSYGNKLMESLYTSTLYCIKQEGDSVKIQIWSKIWFKQGASMKSILENGALGEIKNIVPEVMKNIQKCCRMVIKLRRAGTAVDGAKVEQNVEDQQTDEKEMKKVGATEKEQQSKVNRTIIMLIVGTIVINVVVNFIF